MNQLHTENVERAVKRLATILNRTAVLMADFAIRAADALYLQHHDRLPGSNRTRRLKKKRRTKVIEWFERQQSL
jgi:hypothetical protein